MKDPRKQKKWPSRWMAAQAFADRFGLSLQVVQGMIDTGVIPGRRYRRDGHYVDLHGCSGELNRLRVPLPPRDHTPPGLGSDSSAPDPTDSTA